MNKNLLFIGLDVHKESIEIAVAEGTSQEVRRYGKIGGTHDAMRKTLRKLVSSGKSLHFCYEAGPYGYELYRYLIAEGHDCWVIAPSLIPKILNCGCLFYFVAWRTGCLYLFGHCCISRAVCQLQLKTDPPS